MVGDVRIYLGYSHHLNANGNVFLGSMTHQYIAEKAATFFSGSLRWDSLLSVFLTWAATNNILVSNWLFEFR